jgi:biotin carboxyl carrier protein
MNRRLSSAALLSSSLLLMLGACSKSAPPPEPVRAVKTVVIASTTAGSNYEYAAEIRARVESRLGFRVGGKMVERPVNVGDTVKAGQVLARLDPRDLHLGEEAARAAVASAVVNLQQAQADFKRYRDLRDQGFISGAELERRETTLKVAEAQLAQARAQSGVQGNQAAYAALTADAGGVITGVDLEPGMVVAAGAPVLRLAHDGPRDVVFSVPEDKVALVQAVAARQSTVQVRLWSTSPRGGDDSRDLRGRRSGDPHLPGQGRPRQRRRAAARPDRDGGDRRAAPRRRRPGAAVGAEGVPGRQRRLDRRSGVDDRGGATGRCRRRRRQRGDHPCRALARRSGGDSGRACAERRPEGAVVFRPGRWSALGAGAAGPGFGRRGDAGAGRRRPGRRHLGAAA